MWRAKNFAFDRQVTLANAVPLNLGFPGQYFDAESGNWNNGFRNYYGSLGRYIESDPAGLTGDINTYAYAMNDPTMFVDSLGLCINCTAARKAAGQLAEGFQQASEFADNMALVTGAGTALAGLGETPSFGIDTPATVSLAGVTTYFTGASIVTGAAAASLNAYASGSATSLANFDFTQIEGVLAKSAASKIPLMAPFAGQVGDLASKAADLITNAPRGMSLIMNKNDPSKRRALFVLAITLILAGAALNFVYFKNFPIRSIGLLIFVAGVFLLRATKVRDLKQSPTANAPLFESDAPKRPGPLAWVLSVACVFAVGISYYLLRQNTAAGDNVWVVYAFAGSMVFALVVWGYLVSKFF